MSDQPYYLGIDWGGTRIKLGAVTPDGQLIAQDICKPALACGH